ncbi:hypothetical protein D0Z07_5561 [Hyphodiscus hymeniophilus]|uniref:Uncharacterized protein n=1 Tax=Hyphodiscus hymeniophilus TaxID=353542 RepID=A0A9P6VI47_9HELO|nr:hypothetical protein D0Z07_5561 [Hyphodiscus hymeniophilus]
MCTPGADHTMCRPQDWYVIAPELLQSHYIEVQDEERQWARYNQTLETKIFNPNVQWDAWGKLARPALSPGNTDPHSRSTRAVKTGEKLSMLEGLSNELLDMILKLLVLDKADVVALGLSSQFLWQIVLRHIRAGYLKSASPWAGKMIAFQGSYSTDLPDAFNKGTMVESITGKSWYGNMCSARRFFLAHRNAPSRCAATPYSEESGWLTLAQYHLDASDVPEMYWLEIKEELSCSYLFPMDQEWLLRNLTTKETISSKHFRGPKAREYHSKESGSISFDDVLLMQSKSTAYSSYFPTKPSPSICLYTDLYTPQRVGRAFQVVVMSILKSIEEHGQAIVLILSHLRYTVEKCA